MSKGAWMAVSFACASLVFILVAFTGYLWPVNAWLGVVGCLAWVGNVCLLRYANRKW